MRRLVALAAFFVLAGCGSSTASRQPTATKVPTIAGSTGVVTARVVREITHPSYALLYVSLHNTGHKVFQTTSATPFLDDALVEPTSHGTISPCDSDTSRGPGLQYASLPAAATKVGWIRCDYPRGSHVFAIFWLRHQIGAFRIQR